jgi:poly-gamma-glutamate capsule biosynthesis protein CapA/YwtB (metallophosphatase superfamily)
MKTCNISLKKNSSKNIKKYLPFLITFLVIVTISSFYFAYRNNWIKEISFNGVDSDVDSEDILYPDIESLEAVPYSSDEISLIAVGDFLLDRNVGRAMKERNDYHFPIKNTKHILESADITFCNVECPVCEGREIGITERSFRADPETIEVLTYGGFDIVSLANNHTMNFGGDCLAKTFDYLNDAGIDYVGAGTNFENSHKPLIKDVNGVKLAFLAYNDSDVVPDYYFAGEDSVGTNMMDIEQLQKDIKKVQDGKYGEYDLILVSMHSGTEYTPVPNYRQKDFAHAAIDAGADIILGHHPHHTQHIEQYEGKYIIYSMGNFVLDQMACSDCTKELLLNITLTKDSVKEVEVIPIRQKNFCETNVAVGSEKAEILGIINFETELRTYFSYENGEFVQKQRDVLVDLSSEAAKQRSSETKRMWGEVDIVLYEEWLYVVREDEVIWSSGAKVVDFSITEDELFYVSLEDEKYYLNSVEYSGNSIRMNNDKMALESRILGIKLQDFDGDGKSEVVFLCDGDTSQYISVGRIGDEIEEIFRSEEFEISRIWISRGMIYVR